jgi:hypothetical protein
MACQRCSAPLTGIEGHDGLFAYRMNGAHMYFKCSACEQLWMRMYRGEGSFEWVPQETELAGLRLPGVRST